MQVQSYKDLIVWQKAIDLAVAVYEITESFPKSEIYGLTSQMRRCVVSISSNIAEGRSRGTRKDYRQFLIIASGSGAELGSQVELVKRLIFGKKLDFSNIEDLQTQVMRMLNSMISKLAA